jgi:hypothetical protein
MEHDYDVGQKKIHEFLIVCSMYQCPENDPAAHGMKSITVKKIGDKSIN